MKHTAKEMRLDVQLLAILQECLAECGRKSILMIIDYFLFYSSLTPGGRIFPPPFGYFPF